MPTFLGTLVVKDMKPLIFSLKRLYCLTNAPLPLNASQIMIQAWRLLTFINLFTSHMPHKKEANDATIVHDGHASALHARRLWFDSQYHASLPFPTGILNLAPLDQRLTARLQGLKEILFSYTV